MRDALLVATLALSACHRATPTIAPASVRATADDLPPVGPPRAIRGILIDSLLTNEVLRGALLELDGTAHVGSTSAQGAFTFDSVTPGTHRLVVRHPLLDSLGLDTLGLDVRVPAVDAALIVALPTPTAFLLARCPSGRARVGDGIVLGVVRQPDTDAPIEGVDVAAAWRGVDTTYAGGGLRERARVRTNAAGQFTICRVPRFSPIEIWARRGTRETPRIRVQLGAATLAAYDLSIDAALATDSASAPSAVAGVVSGRILTLTGDGLPNVTVQIDRPGTRTTTDSLGRFVFRQVPPGVRALDIRALGFRPSRVGVNLRPAQRLERDVTLDRTVAVLGTVTIRATRTATWDSVGFEDRKRRGGGYFFNQESLKGITDLSTALRLVPGIRGRSTERSQRLIAGRGAGCYPAFIVNGVRFDAGGSIGPEAMVRANDIRAMEVYTSRLATPPEHQRYADCAVIVIWLRDPQAEVEARQAKPPRG